MKFALVSLFSILSLQFWNFSHSESFAGECHEYEKKTVCSAPDSDFTLLYPEDQKTLKTETEISESHQSESEARIDGVKVGGGQDSGHIPYQVSLQTYSYAGTGSSLKKNHYCGGIIYSSDPKSDSFTKIITAAHCVVGINWDLIYVVAGITDIDNGGPSRQESGVCEVAVHEGYYMESELDNPHNDIALLTLLTPLKKVSKMVEAITLTPVRQADLSDTAQVSGWGDTFESSTTPTKLQVANVTLKSCQLNGVEDRGVQICAGGQSGPDACQGDSGGPLVCFNKNRSAYYLCGIVSNGPKCENPNPNEVGVYTNVTTYIFWIQQNQSVDCEFIVT